MSAAPVRRRKNRKTNTSLGIPHTFSFPLLPTHECRAVNLHMMTLKILFHTDVKWGTRRSGRSDSATDLSAMAVYQVLIYNPLAITHPRTGTGTFPRQGTVR